LSATRNLLSDWLSASQVGQVPRSRIIGMWLFVASASIYGLHFAKRLWFLRKKRKRNILGFRNVVHTAEPFPHIGGL
jgi:hypothetical protein